MYLFMHEIISNSYQEFKVLTDTVSVRTFYRMGQRYEEGGMKGLTDRRLGKVSARRALVDEVMRVLNLFETLQNRLPQELRVAGITYMQEANRFLKKPICRSTTTFRCSPRRSRNGIHSLVRERP